MKHTPVPAPKAQDDRAQLKVRTKVRAGAIWSDATGHFDFRKSFLPTIPNE